MSSAQKNLDLHKALLTEEEYKSGQLLLSVGQDHIFKKWTDSTQDADLKKALLRQALKLDSQYPGGLEAYVANSKQLLEQSKNGVNPYDGYTASVPSGQRLKSGTKDFDDMEILGVKEAAHLGFVLVAGGLGERLGYSGIKLALPADLTTNKCFLETYCDQILALQARARTEAKDDTITLPLFIMTSDDTHDKTVALLKDGKNFGMAKDQILLVKQEKVPALSDNDAHFAMSDPYSIATKPHGHGDVHMLMHSSGVAAKWAANGVKWIVFFQDTNGLVFHGLKAAIGVSKKNNFEVNSLTVPRRPGEAVGAICELKHQNGSRLVINVEYNQLDALLQPKGDVADDSSFSPFPGNINVLIFAAEPYAATLQKTGGAIPEFVNPKYADDTKTTFKKPTRIESMMQDYPKLLGADSKVGFTELERWTCFSAVKNNVEAAAGKAKATGFPECASSGEADAYRFFRKVMKARGVNVEVDPDKTEIYAGVPTATGAHVVMSPSTGLTQAELGAVFQPAVENKSIDIDNDATLVINGPDIVIESLTLKGTLIINAVAGAKVTVKAKVSNAGWAFEPAAAGDEVTLMHGYTLAKKDQLVLNFDQPGTFVVDGTGVVHGV